MLRHVRWSQFVQSHQYHHSYHGESSWSYHTKLSGVSVMHNWHTLREVADVFFLEQRESRKRKNTRPGHIFVFGYIRHPFFFFWRTLEISAAIGKPVCIPRQMFERHTRVCMCVCMFLSVYIYADDCKYMCVIIHSLSACDIILNMQASSKFFFFFFLFMTGKIHIQRVPILCLMRGVI